MYMRMYFTYVCVCVCVCVCIVYEGRRTSEDEKFSRRG